MNAKTALIRLALIEGTLQPQAEGEYVRVEQAETAIADLMGQLAAADNECANLQEDFERMQTGAVQADTALTAAQARVAELEESAHAADVADSLRPLVEALRSLDRAADIDQARAIARGALVAAGLA